MYGEKVLIVRTNELNKLLLIESIGKLSTLIGMYTENYLLFTLVNKV